MAAPSVFSNGVFVPPDSIFDVTRRYVSDDFTDKVNLGQGTYRDENGQPWVLPSVRMAKEGLLDAGHEYLPIAGLPQFRDAAVRLVFHGTKALEENRSCMLKILTFPRVASCQSVSGTGALLLAGLTMKKAGCSAKTVYITDPTWSNHGLLFSSIGFDVKTLPYYKEGSFDFERYVEALQAAEDESALVLHACAHNPTGCDPSREQWRKIGEIVKQKRIFPIFDSAYLGFNSGSVDEDAWAIRYFVEDLGLEACVCMSFAKSMGLYGERVGLTAMVASSEDAARTVGSILANSQRATISNPPVYGARIAAKVLDTPAIAEQWKKDLVTMSSRILAMRRRLFEELQALQTPGDWSHIISQSGMFGYMGISPSQISHLETKYHIYMADTSRISIAGLNEGNVKYVAKALDDTVRTIV
ncbi:aspartate aminotransferase [Dactylonectria macrodidyma]|uniref:Aspartate aminotransferase n=1 Tax=Dactylonectria macrodidyma TaxID=307937 RepID=A0A9P9FLV7_9HYPO|nr:aspartate aminotransferase [Dactylonectria macrodidyma]